MDVVTGSLGTLPSKLLELLKDEYKLQTSVKDQIRSGARELESMHAVLRKVAQVPPDELDELVLLWARDVREASYDMEDILDTFLVRIDAGGNKEPPDEDKVKRLMKKIGNIFSLSKAKARHKIAGAIDALNKQLEDMAKLRGRYTVDDIKPTSTTSIDPRLSALYTKVTQLVGIDEPMNKLIQMLTVGDDYDVPIKETRIVSVVGSGGLGKTTLVKAVYEKLTSNIPVKAFVPVGQKPDLKKVLRDILMALEKFAGYMMRSNFTILDERQLIDELRDFLKDKRYFIVIDDVWDVPSWNTIRHALDDNSLGSKIVITTRKRDVAVEVGCFYEMEPLCYESSKLLFYTRIFGSEDKCPKDFSEVSEKFLKKCGGVPLAIITTSSMLANKLGNIKEWNMLYESIGLGLGSNHDLDSMRKILSLSYYDLPSHLKTCLLYLSTFPEDYAINKYRLIWRWIAEDFVQHEEGSKSLFELGESYFNELLNRSLIQVANTGFDGTPVSCRVHDMVLELICSLSREQNFLTIVQGDEKQSTPCFHSKVRRISLRNTTWPSMEMSKLRSLSLFGTVVDSSMQSVSSCHLLRVLDLESCNLKDHPNVKFVGNLLHLRFLSLADTGYAGELPVEIGRLQFLQTLNLSGTEIEELPSSIVGLRQLMFLVVDDDSTRLPNGLRCLESLEQLSVAAVDSADVAEELGHMKQLTMLGVFLKSDNEDRLDKSLCTALVASIGNLHKMEILFVETKSGVEADLDGSAVVSLGNLRSMRLTEISTLPAWINPESLGHLSQLYIKVAQLRREDIQILGMLPALRDLEVEVSGDHIQTLERSFVVHPDAFPVIITCGLIGNFAMVPLMFPQGSMPRLETFIFRIQLEDFSRGEFTIDDLALGHLPSLQCVVARLYGKSKASGDVARKVEEKLRHEVDVHPNNPSISVI